MLADIAPVLDETKTTCPYCGVGCGVIVQTRLQGSERTIIQIKGDPDHPANYGKLCSKGSKLAETAAPSIYAQVRASAPTMRRSRGSIDEPQEMESCSWDDALDYTAQRFADLIREHGPDSVAFYVSGQLLTEDYYVFNKLAKGLIGTNNIDTNSRLCMSSAVSGYKRTLGADAPPCSYEDLSHAECVFIAGSNMAYAHPVAYRRLEAARAVNPNHTLIVVDPRQTDTARMADLHLQIQPGTDVMLFNAMLHVMVAQGWIDPEYISKHTQGFESIASQLEHYTPKLAASVCGVPEADVILAARWFALGGKASDTAFTSPHSGAVASPHTPHLPSRPTLSLYCQGLNQATTGTDKNTALIALHLASGQLGKPGAGPFSLTGQPNAMGGREVGGLATLLPAHRELSNPQHVQEVAEYWGVPRLSTQPGASAVELFDRLERGEIKAVWIACTNPAHSMPDSTQIQRALHKAELVVVQDAYLSPATGAYADVLLPASTWAEKEGTVTNSERRISRVRSALSPWGQSRHDWRIAAEFGRLLERKLRHTGVSNSGVYRAGSHPELVNPSFSELTLFPWSDVEQVFNEHRGLTHGRDLDITGLSYALLDATGPQQWPVLPSGQGGLPQGTPRLYTDGRFPTESGRAQFVWAPYLAVAEEADARFPWRLNTGRVRDHWHGSSRTGTLAELFGHEPEPCVSLHPNDLKRLGVQEGQWLALQSRRASGHWRVKADDSVPMNQAYIPMHWGPEYLGGVTGAGGVNAFTLSAFDPYSKQPELKHCALSIKPHRPTWECVIFARMPNWLEVWMQVRALFPEFDSALCVPCGREHPGLLFRAIHGSVPSLRVLQSLEHLFGLSPTAPNVLSYTDPSTANLRRIQVVPATTPDGQEALQLQAVMLAGSVESEPWLRACFDTQADVKPLRSFLLSPGKQAPGVVAKPSRMVCTCVGVSEDSILRGIQAQAESGDETQVLAHLQCSLACGTQCGSCVPQIRQMIRSELQQALRPSLPVLIP